jgi:hypothetical protein
MHRPIIAASLIVAVSALEIERGEPGFNEFPIAMVPDIRPLPDGGWMAQINHRDRIDEKTNQKPAPSRVRAYIPPGPEPLTAVIFDLGFTYTADSPQIQAVAKARRWAIVGCLLRYARGTELYDAAMAEIATATAHPELATIPVIPFGFSRNGGRAWTFLEENAHRVPMLCLGGNPAWGGVGEQRKWSATRTELIAKTPALTVVGSRDPYVDYDKGEGKFWHVRFYPQMRQWHAPWGMMLLWGGEHDWGDAWSMFLPYIDTVLAQRGPDLKPLVHDDGWLVAARWTAAWTETWPVAAPVPSFPGDPQQAVWLPNGRFIDHWRGFNIQHPGLTCAVTGDAGAPTLVASPPPGTATVAFRHLDQDLATLSAPPWSAPVPALARGLHHVVAVATLADGSYTASRPITVVDGLAIDWAAHRTAIDAAGAPERVIRLPAAEAETVRQFLAGAAADAAALDALRTALTTRTQDRHVEQREAATALLARLAGHQP